MPKTRSTWRRAAAATVLALGLVGVSACKQGVGERCQINDDCETNICNAATGVCQEPGGPITDAAPINDAPPTPDAGPDAAPIDAAAPDAGIDAM